MEDRVKISKKSMAAINEAVDEGHSIFCLEQLGVSQRVINLLYDNEIRSVADLVNNLPEQLMSIPNFGEANLRSVIQALSNYDKIEDI